MLSVLKEHLSRFVVRVTRDVVCFEGTSQQVCSESSTRCCLF